MQRCHVKQKLLDRVHRLSLAKVEEDTHKCRTCPTDNVLPRCVTFSAPRSGVGTINSRFSIRKDRNNGMDFQYDAVVRNRQERKHMLGGDCECCHEVSGNNPSDDRLHAESPLTSTMRPLVHYRLHDSRSGGRQQSTKHPTTTLHRTTRRMTTK